MSALISPSGDWGCGSCPCSWMLRCSFKAPENLKSDTTHLTPVLPSTDEQPRFLLFVWLLSMAIPRAYPASRHNFHIVRPLTPSCEPTLERALLRGQ